jgi:hypothetical protein
VIILARLSRVNPPGQQGAVDAGEHGDNGIKRLDARLAEGRWALTPRALACLPQRKSSALEKLNTFLAQADLSAVQFDDALPNDWTHRPSNIAGRQFKPTPKRVRRQALLGPCELAQDEPLKVG